MAHIHVLLVEDDPDISGLYITRLQAEDFTVTHKDNGEAVGELVRANEPKPDIILLDLMLPKMNGFDVVRQLRTTSWKSVPIIILTAFADQTRQEEARKLGIDSYFLKTEISPGELVKVITKKVGSTKKEQ